jgi:hypothetical protein
MGWPETAAPSVLPTPEAADLRAWQRKATKALKRGEAANVRFETEHIPAFRQAAIRTALLDARTAEQVAEAFR